jgi:hypothetical protein
MWLMTLYDENEASDLTAKEKRALRAAIDNEVEARSIGTKWRDIQGRTQ